MAHEIKEYCSNTALTDKECKLLSEYSLNEKQFIWLRNSYNYCVFLGLLEFLSRQYPNSHFKYTCSTLQQLGHDVFYTKYAVAMFEELDVRTPATAGLWGDYFDDCCERMERKNQTTLSASAKYQLEELTNDYQHKIAEFIKERTNKLKKPF